jgi:KipI family sensor histidine kinase inhibitor
VLRYGERGALAEVADLDAVLRLYDALRADRPEGVVELVPAARTLLVVFDDREISFDAVASAVAGRSDPGEQAPAAGVDDSGDAVEVPVHYDGPDLARVAELTGLDEAEVVTRHTAGSYRSGFCGFAPGFAYLTGLDESLHVPRRDDPRTKVRAGSVGLAAEFTAVYPRDSPGGWQLIGNTDIALWDIDRDPPALLAPGTPVRFVDAGGGS